jgi:hypothetical protein
MALDLAFKRHSRAQVAGVRETAKPLFAPVKLAAPDNALPRESSLIRRPRVLNAQCTPSWLRSPASSAIVREPPSATEELPVQQSTSTIPVQKRRERTIPQFQWIDHIKLGTLIQGGRELLICCSRQGQMFMLKRISYEVDAHRERIASLSHRHIAVMSFFIATETVSYVAFPYVRFTLEELLYVHVAMEEVHVRTVASAVSTILHWALSSC